MGNYDNVSEKAWMQFSKKREEYESLSERDEAALFGQCIELQLLKAPATAVFPALDEMTVSGSNGFYCVSGYVDSQNSYGAIIRTDFSYNIEKKSNGEWVCHDQFVDSATQISNQVNSQMNQINNQMIGNSILWWVLGILGSIIVIAFSYSQMSNLF